MKIWMVLLQIHISHCVKSYKEFRHVQWLNQESMNYSKVTFPIVDLSATSPNTLTRLMSKSTNEICEAISTANTVECKLCVSEAIQSNMGNEISNFVSDDDRRDMSVYLSAHAHYAYSQLRSTTAVCIVDHEYARASLLGVAQLLDPRADTLYHFCSSNSSNLILDRSVIHEHFGINIIHYNHTIEDEILFRRNHGRDPLTCDVLHFIGNEHNVLEIVQILHSRSRSRSVVIWETVVDHSDNAYPMLPPDTSTLEWTAAGVWYAGPVWASELFRRSDDAVFCGATFKTYGVDMHKPLLGVRIGTVSGSSTREKDEKIAVESDSSCLVRFPVLVNSQCGAPDSPPLAASAPSIVITFSNSFFVETAFGLRTALTRAGYVDVSVMGELNLTRVSEWQEVQRENSTSRRRLLQIAIGPHRPTLLLRRYIVLHSENEWDIHVNSPHYVLVLRNSAAVLVYSHTQTEFIRSLAPHIPVFVVPMFSSPLYYHARQAMVGTARMADAIPDMVQYFAVNQTQRRQSSSLADSIVLDTPTGDNWSSQHNDILMLFSHAERRGHFSRLVDEMAGEHGWSTVHRGKVRVDEMDLFDLATKEFMVLRSKVVLNIHHSNRSVLETHRINHLLSLGKCVISERSVVDPALDAAYEDAVVFADEHSFRALIREYVTNDSRRHAQEVRALNKFAQIERDTGELRKAVEHVLLARSWSSW